ncbi:MAG: efflux RND transporter permease subunit, partial [Nannocystaceae bacterium]
ASATVSGGYLDRDAEAFTLRAVGTFRDSSDIGNAVLKVSSNGQPVLVRHVAEIQDGSALRQGVITYNGEGEAVTGVIMMLLGENSREIVYSVKDKLEEIEQDLPPGVRIEPIYDRANFVERTLTTVRNNLLEGIAVVFIVLAILLGSLRGAIVTVLGIPVAMTIAVFGMHLTGITGDLMSLGAIDFGFLVDGPIVILEALLATYLGSTLKPKAGVRAAPYARTMIKVVRPVAYSVAIIMLVYLPLLGLEGVEGRMFKPMAITMAFALFGALVYSVLFLPALLVLFVPPLKRDGAAWLSHIARHYRRGVAGALRARWLLLMTASAALVYAVIAFSNAGANFVPRIAEGDAVVTIRRSPSINLPEAKKLDLAAARILREFPETETTLAMTGRAEVAIDPVGMDNTDIFVHLAPPSKWETAADLDGLSEAFKDAIETSVPGTFVSVSQPIEDRTNEMISGSRADVQIMIFGSDLLELKQMSEDIARIVKPI